MKRKRQFLLTGMRGVIYLLISPFVLFMGIVVALWYLEMAPFAIASWILQDGNPECGTLGSTYPTPEIMNYLFPVVEEEKDMRE